MKIKLNFLAARSGSKRLPNKHFLKLNSNLKVIDFILRLKAKFVKKIYLCTTKKEDKFISISKNIKKLFRVSTKNAAKRIIDCAKENSIETSE